MTSRFHPVAAAITLGCLQATAHAVAVPTAPGISLFDLKPAGADHAMSGVGAPAVPLPLLGGPCGVAGGGFSYFRCAFVDNINAPANLWAWETEIVNNAAGLQVYNLGFFYPGGPRTGVLTLGAGERFGISIAVDDFLLGEFGARGIWYYYRNAPGRPIGVDASVVESAIVGGNNGGFNWQVLPAPGAPGPAVGNFLAVAVDVDKLDFAFRDPLHENLAAVPEPAQYALWLLGLGALALGRRTGRTAPVPTI